MNEYEVNMEIVKSMIDAKAQISSTGWAFRDGDLKAAIDEAEKLRNNADRICYRLKDLANIVREPMGG